MKYLKKFNNTSDYETFKIGDEFITPNVSYIEGSNEILFNPKIKEGVWNVTYQKLENEECIIYDINNIESLIIDEEVIDLNNINTNVKISYPSFEGDSLLGNDELLFFSTVQHIERVGTPTFFTLKMIDSNFNLDDTGNIFLLITVGKWNITNDDKKIYLSLYVPISYLVDADGVNIDYTNLTITFNSELLSELNSMVPYYGISIVKFDKDAKKMYFYNTEVECDNNIYKIENNGIHNAEIIMKNKNQEVILNDIDNLTDFHNESNKLISVKIPENITELGDYYFNGQESLESVILPKKMSYMGSCFFNDCKSLKSVILPEGITSLDGSSGDVPGFFSGCESLKEITIPKTVDYIGRNAFTYCSSLTSIRCEAIEAPMISDEYTFIGNTPLTGTFYYPEGSDYSTWIELLPSGWTTETFVP